MASSLRLRVALWLVAINLAVGGVALWFALRQAEADRRQTARAFEQAALSVAGNLVEIVAREVDLEVGGLNVARLLAWQSWPAFADALVCDRRLTAVDDSLVLTGVAINPLGRRQRSSRLDEQAILHGLSRAIEEGRPIDDVEGGRAMPIVVRGHIWGGCWFKLAQPPLSTDLVTRYFLPAFVGSTLLLSMATFLALRRFVLDPVRELAQAAQRVAAGDYSGRVADRGQRDELAELARGFNAMTDRVAEFNATLAAEVQRQTEQARRAESAAMTQRRLAAMGELAAGIAHEINNPLGGLLNAVERLGRVDVEPAKRARYLELLQSGLERIRRTVGQLLRFTPRSASLAPVALVEPIEDAIALVRHRAQRQNVQVQFGELGQGEDEASARARLAALPRIRGEAHELGQAILNLLVNALDALEESPPPDGGRIQVALRRQGDGLCVEVSDNGPGVPEADLPRLADLFFTTKAPGKGTGLGLGIVHQVVARHGGRVELRSPPGGGFHASLWLPLDGGGAGAAQTSQARA